MPKSEFLVVDTSAFLKNTQLQELTENVITCQDVVDEIKSSRAMRRLVVLPYDLKIEEPDHEDVVFVSQFAKKTGDYAALSVTDIKVMALTYKLERLKAGSEHLNSSPPAPKDVQAIDHSVINDKNLVGFYMPETGDEGGDNDDFDDENSVQEEETCSDEGNSEDEEKSETLDDFKDAEDSQCSDDTFLDAEQEVPEVNEDELVLRLSGIKVHDGKGRHMIMVVFWVELYFGVFNQRVDRSSLRRMGVLLFASLLLNSIISADLQCVNAILIAPGDDVICDQNDPCCIDGDEAGWITPSNFKKMNKLMRDGEVEEDETPIIVACLTTDFAMQNVLKQIGLKIVTLDGLLIKQVRTWILRCYACFKTTPDVTRVFCRHCGNKTLKRVAVTVDPEGKEHLHINFKRPLTARGKRFPLPAPRGGKHSNNPILSEDQRVPQQRPTRLAMKKTNALEPDYTAGVSPFIMRDVYSKSAMLGIPNKTQKSWERRNPNVVVKRRRKK
ncbi:unnamed protein product [Nesidiocoris tenuis]|uniref:RNA-binding protein NOB1 n=1 Tax=Nesidiocoris tenuis TaxID=355587 RepID=A0A6H5GP25_9HEMI|nr:unnamed protein product [Nesidiocoris tenuis]